MQTYLFVSHLKEVQRLQQRAIDPSLLAGLLALQKRLNLNGARSSPAMAREMSPATHKPQHQPDYTRKDRFCSVTKGLQGQSRLHCWWLLLDPFAYTYWLTIWGWGSVHPAKTSKSSKEDEYEMIKETWGGIAKTTVVMTGAIKAIAVIVVAATLAKRMEALTDLAKTKNRHIWVRIGSDSDWAVLHPSAGQGCSFISSGWSEWVCELVNWEMGGNNVKEITFGI